MKANAQHDYVIYNKIELTIRRGDHRTKAFGRDVLRLIEEYPDMLIAYQAELLYENAPAGVEDEDLCYEADAEESRKCIEETYGIK